MNDHRLIAELAQMMNISQEDAEHFLIAYYKIVCRKLIDGGVFKAADMGVLRVRYRSARVKKNPVTDTLIYVPAKEVISFSVSKDFEDYIRTRRSEETLSQADEEIMHLNIMSGRRY